MQGEQKVGVRVTDDAGEATTSELLFTAGPAVTPQPPPVTPLPQPPKTVPSGMPTALATATVKAGVVRLTLRCPPSATAGCKGRVQLTARVRAAAKLRTVVLGTARYSLKAGRRATVKVKLGTRGRRLVRGKRRVKVTLVVRPDNGIARKRSLTLVVRR